MTKKQTKQLRNDVLSLLTDQWVGKLEEEGQLEGDKEVFGALIAQSRAFKKVFAVFSKYNLYE